MTLKSLWHRLRAAVRARPGVAAGALVAVLALGSLALGLALGTWKAVCHDCPSIAQIYTWEPKQATKILSHDGRLVAELFQERRTPVALTDLPPHVPQAFLAIEDKRFYDHGAFDFLGIARAATNLVLQRRIAGGGSTITQQLARNMFIQEVGFTRQGTAGFQRKLKELRVAQELERVYTKDQILEAYINQVNYGHGWYGVETAAQRYFGKPAADINPAEAALLAAVINLPGRFTPFRNPDGARARRDMVLRLMGEQGYISQAEVERWRTEAIPERPHGADEADLAPYFVEWVREQMDARYGSMLYSEGLRIFTTIDVDMQRRAQAVMDRGWERIESQPNYRHPKYADVKSRGGSGEARTAYLQGLFVVLDPQTGQVRALVGGRDFNDSKFNRAIQARRQPGSVFKTYVFAAAIASGIPASHVIFDSPLMIEQPGQPVYAPKNYDGTFRGPMTLRDALKRSINLVTVKLGLEVGLETVAQTARRLGIETPIPRVPSMPIGAPDVIPLEVARTYAVFANGGVRVEPRSVLRVEDATGRVLWEAREEREQVLDPAANAIVLDMLRHVVDHGTAWSIRDPNRGNLPYEVPAFGKTGTTNDHTDVWFAGGTPDLLGVVWFGFDMPRRILPGADGGRFAAPVWGEFMRSVYFGEEALRAVPQPWTLPSELTSRLIDRETGKLASEWCPTELIYTEIFIPGTEPTDACDLHGSHLLGSPLRSPFPGDQADTLPPLSTQRPRF
jgi:1A family penicillin-binding protein